MSNELQDGKSNRSNLIFVLLWVNLTVAVVALTQMTIGSMSGARQIARMLTHALVYANLSGFMALVFVKALAMWPRPPGPRSIPVLLAGIVVCSALGCLLAQLALTAVQILSSDQVWPRYFATLRIVLPIALMFGGAALVHAVMRQRAHATEARLREKEAAENRTRELFAQARLQALESRIHPHFLFNTLNSISSLIPVDPARAEHVVERLAALLRASLDTAAQPLIPLRQELIIVANYLEIQQIRFGAALRSSVQVPPELLDSKVPPMSVQALVENAVKHGITPQGNSGDVWVSASVVDQTLRIEIRDSGPGFDLNTVPAGRGLDNLVSRLETLFGSAAYLHVCRRDGQCVTGMVVPLP